MQNIIDNAGLPPERCIIAGLGFSEALAPLIDLGWQGDLAYHIYPNWVEKGMQTKENYVKRIKDDIGKFSERVWVTEFGSDLRKQKDGQPVDYEKDDASGDDGDVNLLRGLHAALDEFKAERKPVKGVFLWHGWPNGDNYDFWCRKNESGAAKVSKILGLSRSTLVVEPWQTCLLDGTYTLKLVSRGWDSDKFLTVAGQSKENGGKITISKSENNDPKKEHGDKKEKEEEEDGDPKKKDSQWDLQHYKGNYFTLRSKSSRKFVHLEAGRKVDGAPIVQWGSHEERAREWWVNHWFIERVPARENCFTLKCRSSFKFMSVDEDDNVTQDSEPFWWQVEEVSEDQNVTMRADNNIENEDVACKTQPTDSI